MVGFIKEETMNAIDYVAHTDDERRTIFRLHKEDYNLSIIQFIDKEMSIVDISLEEFCRLGEILLNDLTPRLRAVNG